MNDEAIKLVWRMVLNYMAGRREAMWRLYEEYVKSRYLYVSVGEILAWKGRAGDGRYNAVPGLFAVVESGVS